MANKNAKFFKYEEKPVGVSSTYEASTLTTESYDNAGPSTTTYMSRGPGVNCSTGAPTPSPVATAPDYCQPRPPECPPCPPCPSCSTAPGGTNMGGPAGGTGVRRTGGAYTGGHTSGRHTTGGPTASGGSTAMGGGTNTGGGYTSGEPTPERKSLVQRMSDKVRKKRKVKKRVAVRRRKRKKRIIEKSESEYPYYTTSSSSYSSSSGGAANCPNQGQIPYVMMPMCLVQGGQGVPGGGADGGGGGGGGGGAGGGGADGDGPFDSRDARWNDPIWAAKMRKVRAKIRQQKAGGPRPGDSDFDVNKELTEEDFIKSSLVYMPILVACAILIIFAIIDLGVQIALVVLNMDAVNKESYWLDYLLIAGDCGAPLVAFCTGCVGILLVTKRKTWCMLMLLAICCCYADLIFVMVMVAWTLCAISGDICMSRMYSNNWAKGTGKSGGGEVNVVVGLPLSNIFMGCLQLGLLLYVTTVVIIMLCWYRPVPKVQMDEVERELEAEEKEMKK